MNKFLSIILSIALTLSIICLTLFNKNFIIHEFNKYNIYESLYNETNKDISIDEYTKEINTYIKHKYIGNINNSFSNYMNKYDMEIIIYLIEIITIIIIIITWIIFMNTKLKHDINKILLYSSLSQMILFSFSYIFIHFNNIYVNKIFKDALIIYLTISILLLIVAFVNKYKCKLNKIFKISK